MVVNVSTGNGKYFKSIVVTPFTGFKTDFLPVYIGGGTYKGIVQGQHRFLLNGGGFCDFNTADFTGNLIVGKEYELRVRPS